MNKNSFVFRDPQGRRWWWVSRSMLALLILTTTALGIFIYSLFLLPQLQPWLSITGMEGYRQPGNSPPSFLLPQEPRDWLWRITTKLPQPAHRVQSTVKLGFLDDDTARALQSLNHNINNLTHIAPKWLQISGLPPRLLVAPEAEIQQTIAGHPIKLIPVLTNLAGEHYDPETIEHLLRADPATQQRFAAELRTHLKQLHAHGVIIAWEEIDPAYHGELTQFIGKIKTYLQSGGLELWLNIPLGDDIKVFDLDDLALHVDRFVVSLYYETGEDDPPGPIASMPWVRKWLDALVQYGAPSQWVIGLATFGYDWTADYSESIAFYDAMARAASAGVKTISNPPPYNGPSFTYREAATDHTVWFLDAVTFHAQQQEILHRSLGGIAIDRIGSEDPGIWTILECSSSCTPSQLHNIPSSNFIATVGLGDVLHVDITRTPGYRVINIDQAGNWEVTYQQLPRTPTVLRSGAGKSSQVAITFDDGPDPDWTPNILDILKKHDAKATFFVVGSKVIANPQLTRRIIDEGHTLGNHTFAHPNLQQVRDWRVQIELNATQRAIESVTGRSTLLFRPPYDADRTPHDIIELQSLLVAQQLGYIPVMASIDPLDWERPSVATMLARVKAQRLLGNVLLLHDSGGDRTNTIAALGPILKYLQYRGDNIVPLHTLLDTVQEALNPSIPASEPAPQRIVAGTGLSILRWLSVVMWNFLFVVTVLLLLRTLMIVIIALIRKYEERSLPVLATFSPPISVLIAAYNEEKVIAHTLETLLASDYTGVMEILVIDDGSTDGTAAIVTAMATIDPRLRLLQQANTGKAAALRTACANATHAIVVILDADTQFLPNTITELVRPLQDTKVGAVSCDIKVGNVKTWIGSFQALEYLTSFNLDRRAYDVLEAITVVPGAASAYRIAAIMAAGGIQPDTMAEDTDITLAMHKVGYRIYHTFRTYAITEAPQTARALLRQRQRWSFGILQCLWKHRDLLFNPQYRWLGLFVLPSAWVFHIFLVAIAPLIDLALVLALVYGADSVLFIYIVIFMMIDLILALVACALDDEPLISAWRVLPMRILYRPLLSIAVLYAIQRALRGTWMSWGIQERWGLQPVLHYGAKV